MIEFGDASNEEAPLPNPKKRELMKSAQLQMISMLQGMDTDDGLKQGSITTITQRFDMAHSIIYRLWEHAACMHAMGIIISLKLNYWKKFWEATYLSERVCARGCQEFATEEETYTAKTCHINGSVKNHCALLDCCVNHLCSL